MNDARRRRERIREKGFRALIERLKAEPEEHKLTSPKFPTTWPARVYLKVDWCQEHDFTTTVVVDLPKDNPTAKIEEMQTHGFWVPRLRDGYMLYIPPNQILQIKIYAGF